MRTLKLTILALALAGAFPTRAADPASNTEKELKALKGRIADLEKALQATPPPAPVPASASVPATVVVPGMTADQEQEFNRIKIKAEALEDGRDAAGLKGFKLSGYMDPVYLYNFNKDRATFQFVVPVSKDPYGYDNSYFGTVALDVLKETDNGSRFHLTLIPKRSTGDVLGDSSIIHEATVWIPLGGLDTKLFAGQLPDWSGYEYLAPTQNKVITHNLLFDFTLPVSYTGVGVELVRGKWDLKLMLANMNSSIREIGQSIPMFVARGDYSGGEFWGLGFALAEGYKTNFRTSPNADGSPATNPITGNAYSTADSRFDTVEVDGWYTRGDLTLNAHLSFGQQQKGAITADPVTGDLRTAQWMGISLLAAKKFGPRTEGILRADYLYNQKNGGGLLDYTFADAANGIGPDPVGDQEKGANKFALTAALSFAFNENVVMKGEYRFDGANLAVFGNKHALTDPTSVDAKYRKYSSLVGTSVVFSF